MLKEIIFRKYDIRGIVGTELLVHELYKLISTLVYTIRMESSFKKVVVGMDGRIHSALIVDEIIRALVDSGIEVIFIGLCPTPLLYFSVHTIPDIDGGLMITASHNGPEWNGIKCMLRHKMFYGDDLKKLYQFYSNPLPILATSSQKGSVEIHDSMIDQYTDFLLKQFSHLVGYKKNIIFDCANAVSSVVLVPLLKKMEWHSMYIINETIDGTFPAHIPDPIITTNMHDLWKKVIEKNADFGCGFDGDADRMAVITKQGNHLIGDHLLALYAKFILKNNMKRMVICDIKCSQMVTETIEQHGGIAKIVPSGHSIIKQELKNENGILGGELSCHFFFADRYFGYDDGIYAMMRLIEIMYYTEMSLDHLIGELPQFFTTPECRISRTFSEKIDVINLIKSYFLKNHTNFHCLEIDGIKIKTEYGWGLVRASNTQDLLCIRCESSTRDGLNRIVTDFAEGLDSIIEKNQLMQQLLA